MDANWVDRKNEEKQLARGVSNGCTRIRVACLAGGRLGLMLSR
jgi:hypothetical protein